MPKAREYVFVLWGNQCEEIPATTFIAELREAGLLVKVVGLSGQRAAGTHGLVLLPDLTLGQALSLAPQAVCVIAPCDLTTLQRFASDPRLQEFLDTARVNGARFVLAADDRPRLLDIGILPDCTTAIDLVTYPPNRLLTEFAQGFAQTLFAA